MELLTLLRDGFVALLPDMKDGIGALIAAVLVIQAIGFLVGGALATWLLRRSGESPYSVHGLVVVALGCYMGYQVGPYVLVYLVPVLFCCALLAIPVMLGDAIWHCCR